MPTIRKAAKVEEGSKGSETQQIEIRDYASLYKGSLKNQGKMYSISIVSCLHQLKEIWLLSENGGKCTNMQENMNKKLEEFIVQMNYEVSKFNIYIEVVKKW